GFLELGGVAGILPQPSVVGRPANARRLGRRGHVPAATVRREKALLFWARRFVLVVSLGDHSVSSPARRQHGIGVMWPAPATSQTLLTARTLQGCVMRAALSLPAWSARTCCQPCGHPSL